MEAPEHAVIELFFQNERLKTLNLNLAEGATRFFKTWLPGKHYEGVPSLVTKICGLCPAAHSTCAAIALEQAIGVVPSKTSMQFRLLLQLTETIRNHLIHVGMFQLPDLLAILDGSFVPKNIFEMPDDHIRDLLKKVLGGLQNADKIAGILAGGVSPITNRVGGCFPNIPEPKFKKVAGEIRDLFRGLKQTSWSLRANIDDICEKITLPPEFILPPNVDLLTLPGWLTPTGPKEKVRTLAFSKVPSKHLENLPEDESIILGNEVEYLGSLFDDSGPFLDPIGGILYWTGPLSRVALMGGFRSKKAGIIMRDFAKRWQDTSFLSIGARLSELVDCAKRAIEVCQNLEILPQNAKKLPNISKETTGSAAIEAPRGTLFHQYTIAKGGAVKSANIMVPTDINYACIRTGLQLIGEHIVKDQPKIPRVLLLSMLSMILRTFDPCISCLAR